MINLQVYENAKKLVFSVLKEHKMTRVDDYELLLEVWEYQGLRLTPDQRIAFKKCMPMETITRARREIQATGFFTKNSVYEQRQLMAKEFVKEFKEKHEHETNEEFNDWLNK